MICPKERENEQAYPTVNCQKKIHRLERAQYALLDHSKTLGFGHIIKIEIL